MGITRLPFFTIGHSTRTWQVFVALLKEHQISVIVDIRRFPGSRRYPHFNQAEMQNNLKEQHIGYSHLEALGGRREPIEDSKRNIGWRNKSFRGYADHMGSVEFSSGIEQLLELANNNRVAIMCAEALPWQCHRMLVSDYLVGLCKFEVHHIVSSNANSSHQQHSITSFAKVVNGALEYPAS